MKIIKHLLWRIAALFLLFIPQSVDAQKDGALPQCQSFFEEYNMNEDNSIVRSNLSCRVSHIQYREPSTGMTRHTFVVDDFIFNTTIAFSTYFNATDSSDYYVDITDMEIFGTECYFCGTLIYPHPEMFSCDYIHEGFVGHFPVSSFQYGTGLLVYNTVPMTSSLSRLAISKPVNEIIKINAIGVLDDYTSACLAEISSPAYTVWKATLNTIPGQPRIIFSDICRTADSIILLAQNKCDNDITYGNSGYDFNHQIILLDRYSQEGCYHDYNSVPIYYMAHYFFNDYEECNFHYNKTTMGICPVYENHFGVAFGVREREKNKCGLRYFSFPNIWQYDSSIYYRMGNNPWLRDIAYSDTYNKVLLISRDISYPNGVVSIPNMFNSSHVVRYLTASNYTLFSLAMRGASSYLNISGHDSSPYHYLLSQNIDMLSYTTCFDKSTHNYTVLPEKHAARLVTEWDSPYNNEEFSWITAETFPDLKISIDTVCIKCPNDD